MLRKTIDWESLKIFHKNFYNGVSFSKVKVYSCQAATLP